MNQKTSIEEAMQAWSEWKLEQAGQTDHVPIDVLYNVLIGNIAAPQQEELLAHITACPLCLDELRGMQAQIEVSKEWEEHKKLARLLGWDLVQAKAAASTKIDRPFSLNSEGKKYIIRYTPLPQEQSKGLLEVQTTSNFKQALEGKMIKLRDENGRVLLYKKIEGGEVSQIVEGIGGINLGFSVQEE